MSETTEDTSASAADALGAISTQVFRRMPFMQQFALRLGVPVWSLYMALLIVTAVLAYMAYLAVAQRRHETPVAILIPNPTLVDAAKPQKRGFDGAWRDSRPIETGEFPRFAHYPFPLLPDHPIENQFEELYDQGIRYFIVTMSDTVLKLTDGESSAWAKFSTRHPIDPPMLIATVASAPLPFGADVSRGVIRNYIRSDDEVNQFAAYMDSRGRDLNTTKLFVVYIKDQYGDKAVGLIRERIQPGAKIFGIDARTKDENERARELELRFSELEAEIEDNANALVILVLYGDMVPWMLDGLNNLARENPGRIDEVLVVSTFTEKDWQPAFYKGTGGQPPDQFIRRITTLAPFATGGADGPGAFKDCEGGAVCQFSYMTLYIVLKCAAERGSEDFLRCFANQKNEVDGFPDIELSTTGDSIVPLRVRITERARPAAIEVPSTP